MNSYIAQIPEIQPLLQDADHIDIKMIEGSVSMRKFIVQMLAYQPAWVTFLYGVRWFFVRLLGMKQTGLPHSEKKHPEELPMQQGQPAAFFTVAAAAEERYWFAEISESHLTARLGVVVEPLTQGRRRFHVVTVVHYNQWTGPVYFNVIRPFHHLVVGQMAKAGVA